MNFVISLILVQPMSLFKGLVYVVGCRQRTTAHLAVHDLSTRCASFDGKFDSGRN